MFTEISAAIAFLQNLPGLRDQISSADDALLTQLLNDSAGVDPTQTTHYRPYYVAAKYLALNPDVWVKSYSLPGQVSETRSTPETQIETYKKLQAAQDSALELTVPEGSATVTTASAFSPGRQVWTEDRNREVASTNSVDELNDIFLGWP